MDDRELLAALEGLGLGRENHRAVLLLPLIEVAWADGRIQRAERRRLAAISKRYGIVTTDEWLGRWLSRKPSKKVFLAAHTALLALMTRQPPGPDSADDEEPLRAPVMLEDLLDLCLEVAEAAGGLFGFAFTVTRSERECIEQIATSLQLGPSLPEPVVSAWKVAREKKLRAEAPTSHRPPPRGPRYGFLDQTTMHLPDPNRRPATTAVPLGAEVIDESTHGAGTPARSPATAASIDVLPAEVTTPIERNPPSPIRIPVPQTSRTSSKTRATGARSASVGARGPGRGTAAGTTAAVSFPEEDPTLPFFDHVNVGTYALDPEPLDEP